MVKELTDLLNGTIEVKSEVGIGTEFILRFPITDLAKDMPVEFSQNSVEEVVQGFVKPNLEGSHLALVKHHTLEEVPSLLIVEDNEDVISYILSCVHEEYRTFVARDGAEGIAKAKEFVPDIILSDVMMPKKDGFELVMP